MIRERMLSTGQAAKRLGISVRTIYRWEAAGRRVPITRVGSVDWVHPKIVVLGSIRFSPFPPTQLNVGWSSELGSGGPEGGPC